MTNDTVSCFLTDVLKAEFWVSWVAYGGSADEEIMDILIIECLRFVCFWIVGMSFL